MFSAEAQHQQDLSQHNYTSSALCRTVRNHWVIQTVNSSALKCFCRNVSQWAWSTKSPAGKSKKEAWARMSSFSLARVTARLALSLKGPREPGRNSSQRITVTCHYNTTYMTSCQNSRIISLASWLLIGVIVWDNIVLHKLLWHPNSTVQQWMFCIRAT